MIFFILAETIVVHGQIRLAGHEALNAKMPIVFASVNQSCSSWFNFL